MATLTRPVPHRVVPTRRIAFDFSTGEVPRHYVAGDLLTSHLMTLGSAVFPEGEDFFVRTVRAYRDEIADPELKDQVRGFIGQEATHGREHRRFNQQLAALGYPTRLVDRVTRSTLRLAERVLPRPHQLAITAALEHYTATLAEALLTEPEAQARLEVRALFLWHALEESEHKAVAFDVFQSVSGDHRVRTTVMRFVTLDLAVGIAAGMLVSLLTDPAARDPRNVIRSFRALRNHPFARRDILDRLRDYNRRDFHPEDHDASDLVATWRERLLAGDSPLSDRSSPAGAI
jgi:predicted metal-dependent hydrolase